MKTKQLTVDAMLAAMCAVLGYIALDFGTFRITFESVPIFLAALMFGPVDGLIVGAVGTLIYQILVYGVSATTVLWILPYCITPVLLGLYAKKHNYFNTRKELIVSIVLSELLITTLNTGVIYVDAVMYGYYFKGYVTANLLLRFGICIAKSFAFALIAPKITGAIRKSIR